MPLYLLSDAILFPPVEHAEDGLLAVGGDLRPERLLAAYAQGIFPWYGEGEPILWHSPDPRFVLEASRFRIPTSTRKLLRAHPFRLTMDLAFERVIAGCASAPRPRQRGTWITDEMRDAYIRLHGLGFGHSVEAWSAGSGGDLAGGIYGISLGGVFFGESMFARETNASKVALVALVRQLQDWGIELIDCQVYTPHLARFGAASVPRRDYLELLRQALLKPTRRGPWEFTSHQTNGSAPPGVGGAEP
jgi:leucyl/phenylalanyl-tRNA--protein transferase